MEVTSAIPAPPASRFAGLRILVVEDDYIVATSLETKLRDLGWEVLGPVASAPEACTLIKREHPDAALLDVKLSPGTSAPVARALLLKGLPFVFLTSYSSLAALPDDLRGYRVFHKPVDDASFRVALEELAETARRRAKAHQDR